MARDRASDAETPEHEAAERGLDQHGRHCSACVEHSEKAHQMRTSSEVGDGLRLEKIINERRERRREGDDDGQVPQQRLVANLGPSSTEVWLVLGAGAVYGRASPYRQRSRDRDHADETKDRKKGALWKEGGHPLGTHAPDQSAERRRSRHACHQ